MNRLPEPPARQPHATQAGQPNIDHQAQLLLAAVEDAMRTPTSYRDPLPVPAIGTAAPVAQPGRPPMSQRAVDLNTTILSTGIASIPIGGMASLVIYALGHVDPTSLAIAAAAPAVLAVPILALSRLVKRGKEVVEAAPPVIHQHYTGPVTVDGRTVNSRTSGVWVSNHNQLPPGTTQQ